VGGGRTPEEDDGRDDAGAEADAAVVKRTLDSRGVQ
jgi:hypothetical protein